MITLKKTENNSVDHRFPSSLFSFRMTRILTFDLALFIIDRYNSTEIRIGGDTGGRKK